MSTLKTLPAVFLKDLDSVLFFTGIGSQQRKKEVEFFQNSKES